MAKEIKISLSDDEFDLLQDAYIKDRSKELTKTKGEKDSEGKELEFVDESYIKDRLMNILKGKVRKYDEWKQSVSYSSFEPS